MIDGNERLHDGLKSIANRPELFRADDDAAMRSAIRDHFAGALRHRRGYRRMAVVWAAAAVVALAGVITIRVLNPQRAPGPALSAAATSDVDGNGRVDILDAWRLARDIESGGGAIANDINRDGVIDARDVDAVAMRAVSLRPAHEVGGQAG